MDLVIVIRNVDRRGREVNDHLAALRRDGNLRRHAIGILTLMSLLSSEEGVEVQFTK